MKGVKNMLNAGLIGLGGMGRGHLENLVRLSKEGLVQLKAVCDIDPAKFANVENNFNIKGIGDSKFDFDAFAHYTSVDDLIENEELDLVVIAIPTYLHAENAIKCLNAGINVMSEKPMSLASADCDKMIEAAKKNGKYLMIGQVLRFWGEYIVLKNLVDDSKICDPSKRTYPDIDLGKPVAGYFFRGGDSPKGSWQNWYMYKEKSGGCIQDQHIHDVDMINWLFGMPKAVCSRGRNLLKGERYDAGYDAVSTQYLYDEDIVINSQDDWTLNGVNFSMEYRCNFEKGTLIFRDGKTMVYPHDGEAFEADDKNGEDGYYREIKYFIHRLSGEWLLPVSEPGSTRRTIALAQAERESARRNGEWISLK